MTKLYKLTDENWETHGHTKWGPGVTHGPTSGEGGLCGSGWLHAYTSPELALLLNPIHANFRNPVLWEAEGEIEKSDSGLKVGVRTLTTIRILDQPEITIEHLVRFAILCALEICTKPGFAAWANAWLSGADRSAYAAYTAYAAMVDLDFAAAHVAARAAAYAAHVAAYVATYAADAADAACAAADAACAAARVAAGKLDLIAIAKKALED